MPKHMQFSGSRAWKAIYNKNDGAKLLYMATVHSAVLRQFHRCHGAFEAGSFGLTQSCLSWSSASKATDSTDLKQPQRPMTASPVYQYDLTATYSSSKIILQAVVFV